MKLILRLLVITVAVEQCRYSIYNCQLILKLLFTLYLKLRRNQLIV